MISVRRYQAEDHDTVWLMRRHSILSITTKDYSPQQLQAWASDDAESLHAFTQSIEQSYAVLAQMEGQIVGLASVFLEQGYIDQLYVHTAFQRRGIASALLSVIEYEIQQKHVPQVMVESSFVAKPFFEKHGYIIVTQQNQQLHGQSLGSYIMTKQLA
jgi:putative acetyltransferase